jgi:hypothetical protein
MTAHAGSVTGRVESLNVGQPRAVQVNGHNALRHCAKSRRPPGVRPRGCLGPAYCLMML